VIEGVGNLFFLTKCATINEHEALESNNTQVSSTNTWNVHGACHHIITSLGLLLHQRIYPRFGV